MFRPEILLGVRLSLLIISLPIISLLISCSCLLPVTAAELNLAAKGELHVADSKTLSKQQRNWFDGGTGQLAYNEHILTLAPQYLSLQADTDTAFSARLHAQWHRQPDAGFSITEAWLNWAPLPVQGYRLRGRLGYFYPQMSLENTDTAWTSPYSSSFSAINSWLAEEVKARGAELSVSRPGRFFQTDHSLSAVAGVFQGNDPAGTLLAWRGFAIHNLQTGLGERVNFAHYPSLRQAPLQHQPPWVEPNRELDHRTGYYLGVHWQYQQQTRLRAYYYDNNADPLVLSHRQYAWHTRFGSVAIQHQLANDWLMIAQWLDGSSVMGPGVVDIDFNAWFLLLHYQYEKYSATLRYDDFRVSDKDTTPTDDNNGNGKAVLLALGYQLLPQLQLSAEHIWLNSEQNNWAQQWPWPAQQRQSQTKLILTWRW